MVRLLRFAAVVGLLAVGWYVFAPRVAGHFGWATRWPASTPTIVDFGGREYAFPTRCLPRARTPLHGHRAYRIGTVPVVFGSGLPILEITPKHSGDPAEVGITVQAASGCFVSYALQGGP